ncbi:hypothetical protein ACFOGI_15280 [Virgibacillus xinjiangensis]|uniref:Uncharacterized protein n=1 Tax=Virgibacillus xinjiangensis TaxID=393090 RepID=A0ABV7CZD5_9BACI
MRTHYLELLKCVELFKEETMRRLYELEPEERNTSAPGNPLAKATPLMVNGYPVYQFSYDGMLPLYKEGDREYLALIRNYYHRITLEEYDYSKVETPLNRAVLVIQHHFKDGIIRDLDNRNRKYIIDAIRQTRLVEDDNWKELSIVEEGLPDKQNHIQVYLLEKENKVDFLNYLEQHSHHLKKIPEVGRRRLIEGWQQAPEEPETSHYLETKHLQELWGK